MWFLVTVSLVMYSTVFGGAEEYVANVQINLKKNDKNISICEPVLPIPKITVKKQFSVSVKSEDLVLNGSCSTDFTKPTTIFNFTENVGFYNLIRQAELINNIINVLKCTFYVKADSSSIGCNSIGECECQCDVPVDMRIPNMGFVTVNGNKLSTTAVAEEVAFDSFGQYDFFDGEQAKFAFKRTTAAAVSVQLKLNKNGMNDTIESDAESFKQNIEMYVKFTKHYDRGYVDCIIKHFTRNHRFVIRIFLDRKKTLSELGFRVNGLLPTPVFHQKNEMQTIYEYFDGEVLRIQSVKNTIDYEDNMECVQENIPATVSQNWTSPSIIDFSMNTEVTHRYMLLNCTMKRIRNSELGHNLSISLMLIPNSFNYNPAIRGLSMAKVLLKINGTAENIIHYDYEDGEELNLRCFSTTAGSKWDYAAADVEVETSNKPVYDDNINNYYISGKFKLNANSTSAVVSCVSNDGYNHTLKTTKVKLLGKKVYNERNSDTIGYTNNEVPTVARALFKDKKLWLIGGLIVLFLVILSALIFIGLTNKRKKPVKNMGPAEICYENLPEHNAGPMSAPSQWNEAQYAAPSDTQRSEYAVPYVQSDIYAKPLSKHLRQGAPEASCEDPAYAEVGNIGPTYAQVLPKSARLEQSVQALPEDVNEPTYAEIMRLESNAKPAPIGNPYAEVIRKNDAKTSSDGPASKYSNVVDNKRYVNTRSSTNADYAEPAYCEINALKHG